MEMIADIVVQHENVTIINQENQGISVARNKAISIAKGEYILMLDSDDLIVDNSISVLLGVALADRPDFVVADFVEMTNEEIEKYQGVVQKDFAYDEIRGDKINYLIHGSVMYGGPCTDVISSFLIILVSYQVSVMRIYRLVMSAI